MSDSNAKMMHSDA